MDYIGYDLGIMNNFYEYLLYYNGTSGTEIIPWLAQNYTVSADHKTVDFALRSNITFQDGEPFNSTAVYFSILRGFVIDGSAPDSLGGYGPSWIIQQLANTSLSNVLSGQPQNYSAAWVNQVLAENFIQITGPETFTMNLQHYDAAFPYLFATWGAPIVAPEYTMTHDITTWTSAGYKLPFPTLSGNETNQITQYFDDEVSTCSVAPTPGGCGATYYDTSTNGSLGGTGPYILQTWNPTTQQIVLQANPNYWGGPYQFMGGQKITPQIKTIDINYVPSSGTRLLDLQNAAKTGTALIISETNDQLYDVASRTAWLDNGTLQSIIPGVSLFGPYTSLNTQTIGFNVNVSNPLTGNYYTFQPFADLRIREAFADSVNISQINIDENNGMGQVETELIPPGVGPTGVYNTSITLAYSYNLTASQDLLLAAMEHPLTNFTDYDGHSATAGEFNNTFGCSAAALSANSGTCASPVPQTIPLDYEAGDTLAGAICTQIAEAINNISSTYNMGLTVTVIPEPSGTLDSQAFAGQTYSYDGLDWTADYPWATDYIGTLLAPGGTWYGIQHYNYTILGTLANEALNYSHEGNDSALIATVSQAMQFANNEVMQLQTVYPLYFAVMTSNIQGFFYNPSGPYYDGGGTNTFYFATMY